MSGLWELISYDQYAMFRYLVKSIDSTVNKKIWVAMITESLTGISPWMLSRRLTECCASVVLARQCIARVVVGLTLYNRFALQ